MKTVNALVLIGFYRASCGRSLGIGGLLLTSSTVDVDVLRNYNMTGTTCDNGMGL